MRQFYLENGSGNRYSLMDVNHWLYKPENLGAKFSSKYEQIDGNFIRTQRITKPDDIKGTVMFTGFDKYQKYTEFIRFIAIEPLTLIYVSSDEYKVSVDLKEIEKSEIEHGILECDIKFKRISRWYKHITIYNNTSTEGGKVYDYAYDYTYTQDEKETATILYDGGYDSPTKITIFGPCTNPVWTHYLNNEIIGTGSVTGFIRDSRRLVIDCTKIPYSIREYDVNNNVTNDLYQASDFSTKRFFMLKNGKNRIVVDHDGPNYLRLAVEAKLEYETV